MIALGFEDISVLGFHLPSSSSGLNKGRDIRPSERKIGNKGILIEDLSGVGAGNRQFDPIDFKGRFAAIEGQLIEVAVGLRSAGEYQLGETRLTCAPISTRSAWRKAGKGTNAS